MWCNDVRRLVLSLKLFTFANHLLFVLVKVRIFGWDTLAVVWSHSLPSVAFLCISDIPAYPLVSWVPLVPRVNTWSNNPTYAIFEILRIHFDGFLAENIVWSLVVIVTIVSHLAILLIHHGSLSVGIGSISIWDTTGWLLRILDA